jgi:L-threonylcarbamoyladenylate synthase
VAYNVTTTVIQVARQRPATEIMALAGEVIRGGGLVAFPTETVYGLGANALNAEAVAHIFEAKERPANDPIIVHIHALEQLSQITKNLPSGIESLARRFWPGALTLVLPKSDAIPLSITAGRDTVAVRMPNHPIALALLRASGVPIGAPSANRFSRPSPTTASHVRADLEGHVDVILDGGPTDIGVESTIVDMTGAIPTVLRAGGVPLEALHTYLPTLAYQPQYLAETVDSAPAPGNLLKHYAPHAEMFVFEGEDDEAVYQAMREKAIALEQQSKSVGILAQNHEILNFEAVTAQIVLCGRSSDTFAANLYGGLRALDDAGVEAILVRVPPPYGLGLAVRDRLIRAAEGHVMQVVSS